MKQLEEKQNKVKAEKPAYCLCGKCINGIHPTDNFENRIIEELTQGIEEPYKLAMASAIHSALASQRETFIKEITGEKLHEYYLKAIEFVKPDSYNPNAVRPFKDLSLKQQQIDEYIAGCIINNLTAEDEKQGM